MSDGFFCTCASRSQRLHQVKRRKDVPIPGLQDSIRHVYREVNADTESQFL